MNPQNNVISDKHDFQTSAKDQQKEINDKPSISNPLSKIKTENSDKTHSLDEVNADPPRHFSDPEQINQTKNSEELVENSNKNAKPDFDFIAIENTPKTSQSLDLTDFEPLLNSDSEKKPKISSHNINDHTKSNEPTVDEKKTNAKKSILENVDVPKLMPIDEQQPNNSQKSNEPDVSISDNTNTYSDDASAKLKDEPIDLKRKNEDPNSNNDNLIRQEIIGLPTKLGPQDQDHKSSEITEKDSKRTQDEQKEIIEAENNDPTDLSKSVKANDGAGLVASKVTGDKELKPNPVKLEPEPEYGSRIVSGSTNDQAIDSAVQRDTDKLISQANDGATKIHPKPPTNTNEKNLADADNENQDSLLTESNNGNQHLKAKDENGLLPSKVINDNRDSGQNNDYQSRDESRTLQKEQEKPDISKHELPQITDPSDLISKPSETPSSHDNKLRLEPLTKESRPNEIKSTEQQINHPATISSSTTGQDHGNTDALKIDSILPHISGKTKTQISVAQRSSEEKPIENRDINVPNANAFDTIPPIPGYDKIGGSLEIMNEYGEDNSNIETPVRKSTLEYSTELLDDAFFSEKKGTSPACKRKSCEPSTNITSSNLGTEGTASSVKFDALPTHSAITTVPNYIMSVDRQTDPKPAKRSNSVESESKSKSCTCCKDEPNTIEINLNRPCRLVINVN